MLCAAVSAIPALDTYHPGASASSPRLDSSRTTATCVAVRPMDKALATRNRLPSEAAGRQGGGSTKSVMVIVALPPL